MTKCSTLVPAIRQSGFIISVIYKTYTLKNLSALQNMCLHIHIVPLPKVTRITHAYPAKVPN